MTQEDLLRQIESLSPASTDPGRRTPAVMSVPGSPPKAAKPDAPGATASASLFPTAAGEKTEPAEKKEKGPTEIVALEATFDQKAHIAVFIGQVVVTDPEFNVLSDKLTAYLKHEDKAAPPPANTNARLKATPAPATPAPGAKPGDTPPPKSGGLEKADAEADPGSVVTVSQDKKEADGTITKSIGHGKKAHYDATTGDITLYGHPDMQQGSNTCVSTDEGTIMTLNRDGHMRVTGPHKSLIQEETLKDKSDTTKPNQ